MKQKIFLTLALFIAGMMYVNAQVSIGSKWRIISGTGSVGGYYWSSSLNGIYAHCYYFTNTTNANADY